ncbi:replication factor C p37 subunit [Hesseltinella vesiculosa]|uniref:Replication factor C subunit 2 n=1 Tax=Hesseltinella vesiculosa TaxID=101127 RepID=A0A1X2GP54_9FUNG|nr:replication factor C p37 subunit [Hesseltinella vesiculosa]
MNFFQAYASNNTANKPADKEHVKPWVEKYRPKTIDDIASQEQAVSVLKKALHSDNLPHLLFYGPPGTGKTSTILALAHQLYGPKMIKSRVLELNASDERGISVVRDSIKNFARTTLTTSDIDSKYPCPAFKIVILDEADSMTRDAQSALRRTMETYSKTTRFCIICNYVSRIIEPITSRCAKFRFKSLPLEQLSERLNIIADKENVALGSGPKSYSFLFPFQTLQALIKASNGDLRKAITYLQSGANLHQGKEITPDTINRMAGIVPDSVMNKLIETIQNGNTTDIKDQVQELMNEGYSAEFIMSQLNDILGKNQGLTLTTLQQSKIAQILGTTDIRLVHGADEHVQLLNMLLQIGHIVSAN